MAPFLYFLHVLISNEIIPTKFYDKRDDIHFDIVNFVFLYFLYFWMAMSLVLHPIMHSISQLIFARASIYSSQ